MWVDITNAGEIHIDGQNIRQNYTDPWKRRRHCYDFCEVVDQKLIKTLETDTPVLIPTKPIQDGETYVSLYDKKSKQFVVCCQNEVMQYENPYIFL